jgi:hypothetical protein
VYDIYREMKVPIIGTGGIATWQDAVQVMMAGAALYGVGSAVYTRGIGVFREIERGVREYVKRNRLGSAARLVGLAHEKRHRIYYAGVCETKERDDTVRGGKSPHRRRSPRVPGTKTWHVLSLEEVRAEKGSEVKTLLFRLPEEAQVPVPGQFYMLWIPGVDQKPYSVSWCDGKTVGFSFTKRGPFSGRLFDLKKGEPVGLLGPLGRGF